LKKDLKKDFEKIKKLDIGYKIFILRPNYERFTASIACLNSGPGVPVRRAPGLFAPAGGAVRHLAPHRD
jgi:hypothetical protein